MIRPAHQGIEVWLCVEPVDFRKQMTGLATLVQDALTQHPVGVGDRRAHRRCRS